MGKECDGFENYATYSFHVTTNNDRDLHKFIRKHAKNFWKISSIPHEIWTRSQKARFTLADKLKDEIELAFENAKFFAEFQPIWGPLVWAALTEVNWHQIADFHLSELYHHKGYKRAGTEDDSK